MLTPIIILCILIAPLAIAFIIARINGNPLDTGKYACWGLGLAFLFFSLGHFVQTEGMVAMLPPWVPFRSGLVYATGVLELVIGMALFSRAYQRAAAILAIVVFIAFFPANIYAAVNATGMGGHQWGPVYLLIRAPLQLILIAWAYLLCVRQTRRR